MTEEEEKKGIPKYLSVFSKEIGVREAVEFNLKNGRNSEYFPYGNPGFYELLEVVVTKLPELKPSQYLIELGPWKITYSDSPLIGDIYFG